VTVFGAARPHHAYLFSNRRANRIKVLVHDGIGVWLAVRRLNAGRFVWPHQGGVTLTMTREQFDALVLGLPWQRIGEAGSSRCCKSAHARMHGGVRCGTIALRDQHRRSQHVRRPAAARHGARAAGAAAPCDGAQREAHARDGGAEAAQFAAKSEAFNAVQKSLLEETLDTDLADLAARLEQARPSPKPAEKQAPKRQPLPAELPRREIRHEPESTTCSVAARSSASARTSPRSSTTRRVSLPSNATCAQVGMREVRDAGTGAGRAARDRQGIPTSGLLAQVLVAKFQDHLPLYRQEQIFGRAGLPIPRSTLAQWVGECGVQLQPLAEALGAELRRHDVLHADETRWRCSSRAWQDAPRVSVELLHHTLQPVQAVVFDFAESRGGQHVREFLGLPDQADRPGWKGRLVTDDFSGYKACFELGVTEVGCWAHARRKFHELWANHGSTIAEQALTFYGELYDVEREIADLAAPSAARSAAACQAARRRAAAVAAAATGNGCPTAQPRRRRSTTRSALAGAHALS